MLSPGRGFRRDCYFAIRQPSLPGKHRALRRHSCRLVRHTRPRLFDLPRPARSRRVQRDAPRTAVKGVFPDDDPLDFLWRLACSVRPKRSSREAARAPDVCISPQARNSARFATHGRSHAGGDRAWTVHAWPHALDAAPRRRRRFASGPMRTRTGSGRRRWTPFATGSAKRTGMAERGSSSSLPSSPRCTACRRSGFSSRRVRARFCARPLQLSRAPRDRSSRQRRPSSSPGAWRRRLERRSTPFLCSVPAHSTCRRWRRRPKAQVFSSSAIRTIRRAARARRRRSTTLSPACAASRPTR